MQLERNDWICCRSISGDAWLGRIIIFINKEKTEAKLQYYEKTIINDSEYYKKSNESRDWIEPIDSLSLIEKDAMIFYEKIHAWECKARIDLLLPDIDENIDNNNNNNNKINNNNNNNNNNCNNDTDDSIEDDGYDNLKPRRSHRKKKSINTMAYFGANNSHIDDYSYPYTSYPNALEEAMKLSLKEYKLEEKRRKIIEKIEQNNNNNNNNNNNINDDDNNIVLNGEELKDYCLDILNENRKRKLRDKDKKKKIKKLRTSSDICHFIVDTLSRGNHSIKFDDNHIWPSLPTEGVSKSKNRWTAAVNYKNANRKIGLFDSKYEAAVARDEMIERLKREILTEEIIKNEKKNNDNKNNNNKTKPKPKSNNKVKNNENINENKFYSKELMEDPGLFSLDNIYNPSGLKLINYINDNELFEKPNYIHDHRRPPLFGYGVYVEQPLNKTIPIQEKIWKKSIASLNYERNTNFINNNKNISTNISNNDNININMYNNNDDDDDNEYDENDWWVHNFFKKVKNTLNTNI